MLKRSALLAVVLTLGVTLVTQPATGQGTRTRTNSVIVAVAVDATSMDPHLAKNSTDISLAYALYDPLIYRDDRMRLQPGLAVSWKSISPTVWEFKLRSGVRFSNGEPFSAESVRFTLQRVLDPSYQGTILGDIRIIDRVDVVGSDTVRITTKRPFPVLPGIIAELFVIPAEYGKQNLDALAQRPVGTGPYVLEEWVRGQYIRLRANPDYWRGRPRVPFAEFRPVPEQNTRLALLKTGEADIVASVPVEAVQQFQADPQVQVKTVPGGRVYFVSLNTSLETPLRDRRIRQALNYAVDTDVILKYVFQGRGQRLAGLLGTAYFGYDPSLQPYPYDPARARQLLGEAGYPNGFDMVMEAPEGRYPKDREVAQLIVGQLSKAGVRVDLTLREWGGYITQFWTKPGPPIFYLGWNLPTFDADGVLTPLATPKQTYGRYSNPQLTELLDEARTTLDQKKREELYFRASRLLKEDAGFIFLFQLDDIYGTRRRVTWEPRSDERIIVYNIALSR